MSHRSKHNKPYAQTEPIFTRTRHANLHPVNEVFTPNIPVRQRGPDRFEAVICVRNGCQRLFGESFAEAEERAQYVLRNLDFNRHFEMPEKKSDFNFNN